MQLIVVLMEGHVMMNFSRRSVLTSAVVGPLSGISNSALAQDLQILAETLSGAPENIDRNPVLYWNRISRALVIADHSIVSAADAVAPGPCAAAKALGIVHSVIADAVAHLYPASTFSAQFK